MLPKTLIAFLILIVTFLNAAANSCLTCHRGIEPIRDHHSRMMQKIFEVAKKAGAAGNDCIVCHGGNPEAATKEEAHSGTLPYFKTHKGPKAFYPYPGSPWINQHTCGMCHPKQVAAQGHHAPRIGQNDHTQTAQTPQAGEEDLRDGDDRNGSDRGTH